MDQSPKDLFGERQAPFRTRTQALFAADGRTAVVLRRGPNLHHRLISWDLAKDSVVLGQWMKGTVESYDLNHAGTKLIYWARQWHRSAPQHHDTGPEGEDRYDPVHQAVPRRKSGRRKTPRYMRDATAETVRRGPLKPRRNEGVWTAVSTPPYFSAFAIWPCYGHWTGGGWFADDLTIVLQEDERGLVPKVNVRLPDRLRLNSPLLHGSVLDLRRPNRLATAPTYVDGRTTAFEELRIALKGEGVRWVDWFYPHKADLLFAADGQLFRLSNWREVKPREAIHAATLLLDMRPMRFELVQPPATALRWDARRVPPAAKGGLRKGGQGR